MSPSVPALPSGQAEVSKELSSPGVSSEDVAKRLRDLNELRKEGILDDEEFLVAKRQLLGGGCRFVSMSCSRQSRKD